MSQRNIAVIGSGAREHALCWKLSQSPSVSRIIAIPGNAGTAQCPKVTNHDIKLNDFEPLCKWLKENLIYLVVVGPEVHLAAGMSNALWKNDIMCFGPSREAARIECDKEWSKQFMDRHRIPTARWKSFNNADEAKDFIVNAPFEALVVKAAGLAGGKGVIVANDRNEARLAVDNVACFGDASNVIIVEELLEGEELSVLAFTDGVTVQVMLPVQDHKKLSNDDQGPNTGGMGAFCPFALNEEDSRFIEEDIIQRAVSSMASESNKFVGVLYAGLMMTRNGIKVLEFNCRFGDPEAQVLMPLLDSDLYEIIQNCCNGDLATNTTIKWKQNKWCVGVVIASKEYPYSSEEEELIADLSLFEGSSELHLFHGNTYLKEESIVVRGGRVFNVVAVDDNLIMASAKATKACENVELPGSQYRTDIGWKGIVGAILKHGKTTYKSAGVDIVAGDRLIKRMLKAVIESTFNEDVLSSIGGFGAIYDPRFTEYRHPVLVSSCDGVGTKLKIAQLCRNHTTIGQDLVAMCVNDILAQGAKPLFFLDYFACGKLQEHIASGVISSIAKGCREANCALVGGETAEMPGFYENDEYDLSGFVVGIVEKTAVLPKEVKVGDRVIYLPSSGIHSNGYSLVRKILAQYSYQQLSAVAPFSDKKKTFADELMMPTKIYTEEILPLVEKNLIKAFAHITGGGLLENVGRVLPADCKVELDASNWNIPPIFGWLALTGNINETEMLRTFNCGVGGIVIVSPQNADQVAKNLRTNVIGQVHEKSPAEPQVRVRNFEKALSKIVKPLLPIAVPQNITYKRVAVLISGTGTNLKALIESTMYDPFSPARVVLVISNSPTAAGIAIADAYGIPVQIFEPIQGVSNKANDERIMKALQSQNIDLICLAGYMRILSPSLVEPYRGRIINTHPSLLPAFKGKDAAKQALDGGVKFTGCTVHFVECQLDSGAIIAQSVVPVLSGDNEKTLTERIKKQEHELFPHVLKLLASGKVALDLETKRIKAM